MTRCRSVAAVRRELDAFEGQFKASGMPSSSSSEREREARSVENVDQWRLICQ